VRRSPAKSSRPSFEAAVSDQSGRSRPTALVTEARDAADLRRHFDLRTISHYPKKTAHKTRMAATIQSASVALISSELLGDRDPLTAELPTKHVGVY
jgi:hypothetical protein